MALYWQSDTQKTIILLGSYVPDYTTHRKNISLLQKFYYLRPQSYSLIYSHAQQKFPLVKITGVFFANRVNQSQIMQHIL